MKAARGGRIDAGEGGDQVSAGSYRSALTASPYLETTRLNIDKLIASLDADLRQGNRLIGAYSSSSEKTVLVVTDRGVRIVRPRLLSSYTLTSSIDYSEVEQVQLVTSRIGDRSTMVSAQIELKSGRRVRYSFGLAMDAYDYSGRIQANHLADHHNDKAQAAFRDLEAGIASAGTRRRTLSEVAESLPPEARAAASDPRVAKAFNLLRLVAERDLAGAAGEPFGPGAELERVKNAIIECYGSAAEPDHIEAAKRLQTTIVAFMGMDRISFDDVTRVMAVPETGDGNMEGGLASDPRFGLSSMAVLGLAEREELGGDGTGLGSMALGGGFGDLPTEIAAWYAVALVRLQNEGTLPPPPDA